MKKLYLAAAVTGFVLTLIMPYATAQNSQDANVSVEIDESCALSIYDFQQPGQGGADPKIIGEGGSGYFSGTVANTGNFNASVNFSINVYSVDENGTMEEMNTTSQPGDYENQSYSLPHATINENKTSYKDFLMEFNATYDPGDYIGQVETEYTCDQKNGTTRVSRPFIIISALGIGEGEQPDDVGQDNDVDFELDLDKLIEALNKTSDLDTNTTEMENASLDLDALIEQLNRTGQVDTDVNRTENASLETDADETAEDSTPQDGDNDSPGQTPEPEPQPEPDPQPLLSISIKPLNTTYEAPRGRFTEIGLQIENIGEESIGSLELGPRFSEGMAWQSQSVSINSLGVDESANESVFVNPDESVDPGLYQIPVYGSNPEADIGMQYVNVEVTQEVFSEALSISEAPQDIRFEMNSNYTVPILLQNDGEQAMGNVSIELQNADGCGMYTTEEIEGIEPGSSASSSIQFTASDEMNECSATVVASTETGSFAFSEMNIETVEEVGIVPEEFRIPIVASMWTLMLLAYAVLTKRYGIHNMTVKIPLVLLVVGEAFILIYLSSVYYNLIPPVLLPF